MARVSFTLAKVGNAQGNVYPSTSDVIYTVPAGKLAKIIIQSVRNLNINGVLAAVSSGASLNTSVAWSSQGKGSVLFMVGPTGTSAAMDSGVRYDVDPAYRVLNNSTGHIYAVEHIIGPGTKVYCTRLSATMLVIEDDI